MSSLKTPERSWMTLITIWPILLNILNVRVLLVQDGLMIFQSKLKKNAIILLTEDLMKTSHAHNKKMVGKTYRVLVRGMERKGELSIRLDRRKNQCQNIFL